jgi:type I restriction enzyme S subunit
MDISVLGSSQPFIDIQGLKDLHILIPPLSEQQQIVEYLDEQTGLIDKTISIEEKRIELLKEYRQSLISEVVTGKLKVTTDE